MSTGTVHLVGRRWLLTQAGRGVLGFAVLGLAGCSGSEESSGGGTAVESGSPEPQTSAPGDASDPASPTTAGLAWSRVNLGFVAAYVLVRGREAAVVDNGVGGSADAIGAVLD